MVKIIKVSDEFFTEFDKWREEITVKNNIKKPLSRPEASDLLRQLLPDINVNIEKIPRTVNTNIRINKKTKTDIKFDLDLRRRLRWN